jgi:hypothetical protein
MCVCVHVCVCACACVRVHVCARRCVVGYESEDPKKPLVLVTEGDDVTVFPSNFGDAGLIRYGLVRVVSSPGWWVYNYMGLTPPPPSHPPE